MGQIVATDEVTPIESLALQVASEALPVLGRNGTEQFSGELVLNCVGLVGYRVDR